MDNKCDQTLILLDCTVKLGHHFLSPMSSVWPDWAHPGMARYFETTRRCSIADVYQKCSVTYVTYLRILIISFHASRFGIE